MRAFLRDNKSPVANALEDAEMTRGDLSNPNSIRNGMDGGDGVFRALPSSAAVNGVTDKDEVNWRDFVPNSLANEPCIARKPASRKMERERIIPADMPELSVTLLVLARQ